MSQPSVLPTPEEPVLSTLNADGSRRWLRPRLSQGRFERARRITAWLLMILFVVVPFLRIEGRPIFLFDIARWQVTLFGKLFLPSDTVLLAVGLLGILVALFLVTAILGRIWCGWACPQTVYMEFLYRPIERFFDGKPGRGGAPGRKVSLPRSIAKYLVFMAISLALAHVFLSYFVGVENLRTWMGRSPTEHPTSFLIVALTTVFMFGNFAWFREQTCIVACPYGRLQSVLVDRESLIVSYDARRGEPRGRRNQAARKREAESPPGDCVDCGLCVDTCPTGIDIRGGLRMECIACAQCIDACDTVMDKIHRPRGLIRYSSQRRLDEGQKTDAPAFRLFRPRTFIYSAVLAGIATLFVVLTLRSKAAEATLLRGLGAPFTQLPSGEIANPTRLKVANRTHEDRTYRVEISQGGPVRVLLDETPLRVPAGASITRNLLLIAPAQSFASGKHEIRLRLLDGTTPVAEVPYRMLGPQSRPPQGNERP